jgi:hypothetical protein
MTPMSLANYVPGIICYIKYIKCYFKSRILDLFV